MTCVWNGPRCSTTPRCRAKASSASIPRATVSSAPPYTTSGLRPSCSPGSRTMLSRALRSTPSPLPPVRASLPLRRCLPSPWSTTITSRGRHRTARGAPSSRAASHELHHEQHQVVGPRLGPRSLVVARPCAPPPRSRAVAWPLLEFPRAPPDQRLRAARALRDSVRDRGQMQRTAAGIGQERAARLDALERAAPEWRPWVELLRATFQADADLAPAPEPLTPDARPRTPVDIAPLLHGRTVRLDAGRLRSLVQRLGELR